MSPAKRVGREAACEALFPHLGPAAAANELRKVLSMAKRALSSLGEGGSGLLVADRSFIWAEPQTALEVDYELHQQALRSGLSMAPGAARDNQLALSLATEGVLLEDEPYAEWALRSREALEALRQEARLALARDRARGYGRSRLAEVVHAWEACFRADPSSEEAATGLVRGYSAQGHHALALTTYRRCREALEELGLGTSPALEEALATGSPSPRRPMPSAPAARAEERRLVSVLFAELGGRPARGDVPSPEDLGELVGSALAEVMTQVQSLGGMVSSVSGTGLVALFGAPEAHEDDPERALRAALRSVGRVDALGQGLYLRVGIETGPAVVGSIGVGAGSHYGAVGQAVGIAAALQSFAKPSSVLVGPATLVAVEGIFELGGAEQVAVAAGESSVSARYLERPRPRPIGGAARRRLVGGATLVGRDGELTALREAVRDATTGRGGVVVLVGEPGLGKTRLVQECRNLFMGWVGAASGRLPLWLEGRAVSYGSAVPYGLYQQVLCAWVGVTPEEDEGVARAALGRALKATFGGEVDRDQLEHLLHVMGFGAGPAVPPLSRLGPEQLQHACFAAVRSLVARLITYGPTVLVLEDLHWADPTSLRLTEALAPLVEDGRLLLLLTRRPEPDPGTSTLEATLLGRAGARKRRLELEPLAKGLELELAYSLLGKEVPDEIVRAVSEGADGNPLFLEERLASLLETNALLKGDDGRWRLELGAPGQVPEALERLVRARVDRLGPGPRDAVVAASVLGLEFSLGLLADVTDLDDGLAPAVSDLCSTGLLVELGSFPEATYRFRHALIQEAIYKGLLRRQRSLVHARAAWALEAARAGRSEEVASLLGLHFAMAGEPERAARYLEIAGDRAAATFANDEAVGSYRWALQLLGQEDELAVRAVGLRVKLGSLYWRLGSYREGRAALREAVEIVPEAAPLLAARCHRWLGQLEIEDCRDAEALACLDAAEAILQGLPEKGSDDWAEAWLEVQLSRSNLHYWRNECDLQAALLSRIQPLVDGRAGTWQRADFYVHLAGQRWRAARFAVDDSIVEDVRAARAMVAEDSLEPEGFHWQTFGFVLLLHGELSAARAELDGALGAARRAGDRSLELANLTFLAWACLRQHDLPGVKEMIEQSTGLLQTDGFPTGGMMRAMSSWVAWKEGHFDDVEDIARDALERWRPCLVRYPFSWICRWPLIAVRLARGRDEEAMMSARDMVRPPQMRMPAPLEALLGSALAAWEAGRRPLAVRRLGKALQVAEELSFV
jgi:DNA-binding SARP family transcriptional activator